MDLQAVLGETFWEDFHDAMVISLVANPEAPARELLGQLLQRYMADATPELAI